MRHFDCFSLSLAIYYHPTYNYTMARIKIDLPQHFPFNTEIKIRITDLNYGGHVGNDVILGLMHEGRMQFLRYMNIANEVEAIGGNGLIQTDAAIVYKAETFYGETLLVEIAVDDFNKYGFDFIYKISKTSSGAEVARGKTGVVCFDYKARKIVALPDSFKQEFQI